jgi:hypothetical protein
MRLSMNRLTCNRCRQSLPNSAAYCSRCGLSLCEVSGIRLAVRRILDVIAWTMICGLVLVALVAGIVSKLG